MNVDPGHLPLLPDECPAVSYEIEVARPSDYLTVCAGLIHRMPDGSLKRGIGPLSDSDDLRSCVYEPCWLLRLLGDTTERRLAWAKARVARAAERRIAQQRRLDAVAQVATS